MIADLFLELLLQDHRASAPHRATFESGVPPFGPFNSPTSFSIPPNWRTVRRARRNRATFAIVSAERH